MLKSVLDLVPKEILSFVTGKGGTGKSFLSCINALRLASQDKKVLIIDSEDSGAIAKIFEHDNIGYEPVEVYNNVFVLQINTDDALAEYLKLYAKIPSWAKITPLARFIDLVSHAAPGVKEILVSGKICYEARKIIENDSEFDAIIVDAPSSGHVISLLDAPNALSEIVTRGGIRNQTQWMTEILQSKDTAVTVVTLAEEIVVSETIELIENIEIIDIAISSVIINNDLSHDVNSQPEAIETESETIDALYRNYVDQIAISHRMKNLLSKYNRYSFPRLASDKPRIRSLVKHHSLLKKVES